MARAETSDSLIRLAGVWKGSLHAENFSWGDTGLPALGDDLLTIAVASAWLDAGVVHDLRGGSCLCFAVLEVAHTQPNRVLLIQSVPLQKVRMKRK